MMDEMECAKIYGRRAGELIDQNARLKAENARLKEALKDLLVEAKYLYQYYPNFRQTAEEYFSDEIKIIKAAEEES
jgi:regulator of replication initiation timing